MAALGKLNLIPPGTVQRAGAELLAAVASTAQLPANELQAQRYTRPSPEEQRRLKALTATVKKIADDLQLSPEVLATRRDLVALMSGRTDIAPLQSWRRPVIGDALLSQNSER